MPSRRIRHLTVDEALSIHERMIDVFGGLPGVRDPGLLESALFRPRTGYYKDLVQMAAALFESLVMNHPFIDGNKRAAFFSMDVFLRRNGYRMRVEPKAAHAFIIGHLEDGTCDFAHLEPWIRSSVVRLAPGGAGRRLS